MSDQTPVPVRTYRQTCRVAPSQWEGELDDGRMFYVRVRHGHLEVRVSPAPSEGITDAARAPAALLLSLDDPKESFMDEKAMKDSTADVLDFAGAIRSNGDPIVQSLEGAPLHDPDGYEVEIWYELPTSADSPE